MKRNCILPPDIHFRLGKQTSVVEEPILLFSSHPLLQHVFDAAWFLHDIFSPISNVTFSYKIPEVASISATKARGWW